MDYTARRGEMNVETFVLLVFSTKKIDSTLFLDEVQNQRKHGWDETWNQSIMEIIGSYYSLRESKYHTKSTAADFCEYAHPFYP